VVAVEEVLERRRRARTGVAAVAQGGEQRRAVAPAPAQQRERVDVELLGRQVRDGREVLAGHGPVGARAVHRQLRRALREQRQPDAGEDVLEVVGDLAGEQRRRVPGVGGQGVEHRLPRLVGEGPQPDPRAVGLVAAALHDRGDRPRLDRQLDDLPGAGVGLAAVEATADAQVGEHREEPPRPPRLADGTTAAPGDDPVLDGLALAVLLELLRVAGPRACLTHHV
jgi:hypothetical protein